MKGNIKFFTIVISLLLLSSIILTGCMYAIAADNGEMKSYDLNGQKSNSNGDNADGGKEPSKEPPTEIIDDAPLAQDSLQAKFKDYLHQEGKVVTVFSEEQYTELKAVRESGKRSPLTYDEILFLVNDSISMYFSYDEIRLTNAAVDGISHKLYLSSNAEIIYPYHGDYSEFNNYDTAYAKYEKILEDIYSIIYYRIYMHDAGFEEVTEAYGEGKGTIVFADGSEWDKVSSIVPQYRMQLLSLNKSKISGQENKDYLVSEWKKIVESRKQVSSNYIDSNYVFEELDAPLLTVYHYADTRTPLIYQLFITDPRNLQTTKIYPTSELMSMQPRRESLHISGDISDKDWGPYFALYPETGRFSMSLSSYQSFALIGKYNEDDGVLKLYPENVEHGAGYFSYVFMYEDNAWVYKRENSVPPKGAFDIEDGLKFRFVKDSMYSPYSTQPIQTIKDYARENGIPTDEAQEPFFEDDKCIYSFPSIRSEYIIVIFADGTEMPVKEALEKGYISIRALDVYSIQYIIDEKN